MQIGCPDGAPVQSQRPEGGTAILELSPEQCLKLKRDNERTRGVLIFKENGRYAHKLKSGIGVAAFFVLFNKIINAFRLEVSPNPEPPSRYQ